MYSIYYSVRYTVDASFIQPILTEHFTLCQALCWKQKLAETDLLPVLLATTLVTK